MKKTILILLSVVLLVITGCGNKDTEVASNMESTENLIAEATETESVSDVETTTESVEQETETEESEETNSQSVNEDSESNASKQSESNTIQNDNHNEETTSNKAESQPVQQQQSEPVQTESTPESTPEPEPTPEPQVISYSPQNVVTLATAKTKAAGKILLTENLDNLLANGQITKEEYDEYYPYDGAGYYSVFVASNMAEARSVSGTTSFNSEDEIAQYISDMLVLENGPYFLIEYVGTYDYYGKQCYEFRCYRA